MERLLKTIEAYETLALEEGKIDLAIGLNKLYNEVRFEDVTVKKATYQLFGLIQNLN